MNAVSTVAGRYCFSAQSLENMELDECTELFIRGKNIYILLPSLTFSIFICFALKHKLLKLDWHCRSDVLPTDSCQPMLIHTVVNDKKDLPLQRDRLTVKFKFSGGRVLCETADYGSDPHSWCWASTPAPAVLREGVCKGAQGDPDHFRGFSDRSTVPVYPAGGV